MITYSTFLALSQVQQEQALRYLVNHHWFFGLMLFVYVFRLHTEAFMPDSAR